MLKRLLLPVALLVPLTAAAQHAAGPKLDFAAWSRIVVQADGRMKPLDTLASERIVDVAGRSYLKPAGCHWVADADVTSWSLLADRLRSAEPGTPAGAVAALLPPALRGRLADMDMDTADLERQLAAAESAVEVSRLKATAAEDEELTRDRFVQWAARGGSAIAAEAQQRLDAAAALERRIDAVRQVKADTILALNDIVALPEFADREELKSLETSGDVTDADAADRAHARNRALLSLALGETLAPLELVDPGFVNWRREKIGGVELYVTLLLTWQGWDRIDEQAAAAGGSDVYTLYHEPDAWEATPMIDARHEGVGGRLRPELAAAVSPRAIAANRDFRAWGRTIFAKLRAAGGGEPDWSTPEEKAWDAFKSLQEFQAIRTGADLHVYANQTRPSSDADDEDADAETTQNWQTLRTLLGAEGLTPDPVTGKPPAEAAFALPEGVRQQVREQFLAARAAFLSGDPVAFSAASERFADTLESIGQASHVYPQESLIAREMHYNAVQPFLWTVVLALAATVTLALAMGAGPLHETAGRALHVGGFGLLLGAVGMMTYGGALRILISGRPPVTNMYETMLWAPYVAAILGVVFGLIYRAAVIPLGASLVLAITGLLAYILPIEYGQSIEPLNPVLRDNFWLTVHVLTIVASYGAFLLAWGLGNIGLAYHALGKEHSREVRPMALFTYRAMQVGVLLLFVGTVLGGWWAADSWGRFWGWDPKETWAALALVAYLVPLHLRFVGVVKQFGLMAAAVVCFSFVVMCWYGVNFILGAGLHAYGFGEGGQGYVYAGAGLNLAYVVACGLLRSSHRDRRSRPAADPDVAPELADV